jgi:hypothetical protein
MTFIVSGGEVLLSVLLPTNRDQVAHPSGLRSFLILVYIVEIVHYCAYTAAAVVLRLRGGRLAIPNELKDDWPARLIPFDQLAVFAVVCQLTWLFFGASAFAVAQHGLSRVSWLLYGVDNVLRTMLFDAAEIYRISLSGIEHSRSWLVSTFILTYRMSLALWLMELVLAAAKRSRLVPRNWE